MERFFIRLPLHLRAFLRRTDGAVTIELIFSVLLINTVLSAFFLCWGAFNAHALVDRATYTVSDLVTRQRGVTLQRQFLAGLDRTAEFMLDPGQDAGVRFTQVTLVAASEPDEEPVLTIDWSYSPCDQLPAGAISKAFDTATLPEMAVGSTLIVTDVQVRYDSFLDLIPSMTFERRAAALYRFEQRFDLEGAAATSCPD